MTVTIDQTAVQIFIHFATLGAVLALWGIIKNKHQFNSIRAFFGSLLIVGGMVIAGLWMLVPLWGFHRHDALIVGTILFSILTVYKWFTIPSYAGSTNFGGLFGPLGHILFENLPLTLICLVGWYFVIVGVS